MLLYTAACYNVGEMSKQKHTGLSPRSVATNLAEEIRNVASKAKNEEELRIRVEKLLEPALRTLEITAQSHYERHISRTILAVFALSQNIGE